jgi:hypothetical protein
MNSHKTLDQQIQNLLKDAPSDPEMRQITEIFVPVLRQLAGKFRYTEYYVLQSPDDGWVSFDLSYRTQSNVEKTVIYAFSSIEDVSLRISTQDLADLAIAPVGIVDLLFQFFAFNLGDSLVVFEVPGDAAKAIELTRSAFQALIKLSLDPSSASDIA